MTVQTFLFLPLLLACLGYSAFKIQQLYRLLKAHGETTLTQVKRQDRLAERVKTVILDVFGQRTLLRDPKAGLMHTVIFWGFLFITIGTLEQFATTLHADAHFEHLFGPTLYAVLARIQDFFTLGVLLAVFYAFYRRLVQKIPRLGNSKDALIILAFTGSLMISIFLMNGFHILGHQPWYEMHMPISRMIAGALSQLSFVGGSELGLALFFKWIHMLLVLGFAVYIPNSKHLHVLAAAPNVFLRNLDTVKPMRTINFENESIQQYGAARITHLSWKDALDYYACTECGRCQDVCPAWNSQKPLSPKNIITDLKYNLFRQKDKILGNKLDEMESVIDSKITHDVIWACTSCRACETACPVYIEQTEKIYDIRRNLVMMESNFPAEVQTVFKNLESNATPWAFSAADRARWTEGTSVKTVAQQPDFEVLLWVGCAGSYDDRNKKVIKAFVSLLDKASVKFSILGNEEQCTGDPARRIGNEYLFQTLAKNNVETLNRYKVKKIVTACPHCFNTLKNEYPDFGGHYEVIHHSQMIAQLLATQTLKPKEKIDEKVTFHDSCYLGRWNDVYSAPRDSITAVSGQAPTEMSSHHQKSLCCGAGGGRMFMEEKIGQRINIQRTEQALATGAKTIASACPFCMTMLTDGVKAKNQIDQIKVQDIAEIVDLST